MRKRRFTFWLIVTISIVSVILSLPKDYKIKFNIGKIKIEETISSPDINVSFGNLRFKKEIKARLGLDLEGGSHLVFEADLSSIEPSDYNRALDAARDTIERRVNFFGIAEANVQTAKVDKSSRIIVELPGIQDTNKAINLIGKTAQLTFREQSETSPSAVSASPSGSLFGPFTTKTKLTGRNLKRSQVEFDNNSGSPIVAIEFDKKGSKLFEEITKRNVGKPLAIFLDNQIVSAPTVNEPIKGGKAIISGTFTTDEAKQLATQLNAGALPVPIKLIEERNIGPTLGQESVTKSLRAGFIGISLVALFMVGFYGRLGAIAAVALVIYGLVSFSLFKLIPVTLTLSGIAGFMLSIGMAVDANILIFERMREEVRNGCPWQQAMEVGFGRAWDSIRDANVATLLTTFILFNPLDWSFLPRFGMVRGFALTLAIGVIVGLFTGVLVTRNLVRAFYKKN